MRKDKEKAINLRRQGKSYKQISRESGIATSTLAGWLKNEPWSREIRNRLSTEVSLSNPKALAMMLQANKERWKKQHQEYRDTATREFSKLKDNPLFIAGLMLYWGEGDKTMRYPHIKLANSDPAIIKLFYIFLRETLGISAEKIKAYLLLYPDLVDTVQKNFWSTATGIPIAQFNKSVYITGRHPTRRLSYGVCYINFSSRRLKEKLFRWIEMSSQWLIAKNLRIDFE